jgi:UDP-glucose 4-epimerase
MKILVIGSKGFIGTHVSKYFESLPDHELFECDVVTDYVRPNYFLIDASNSNYQDLFRTNFFDICINCAGAASVSDSFLHPLRDFTLNTHNVVKILEAIRLFQPGCKMINLSSAAVYGSPNLLPVREDFPLTPISPYGTHKMQAEMACQMYHRFYGIRTCSLRIFSAYGNGLKKQIFWDLFQKAKKQNTFELYGTGSETRDFIHIDDVVQAVNCCIAATPFEGEAINVANGEEITISTAVAVFLSFFPQVKTPIFNEKIKVGDPLYWKADNSKLLATDFKTSIDLKTGLEKYYLWASEQ